MRMLKLYGRIAEHSHLICVHDWWVRQKLEDADGQVDAVQLVCGNCGRVEWSWN